MYTEDNKAVVRRYLLEGLGGSNPDVVDEVFAPDHVLSSPELGMETIIGTQIFKSAIEEFRSAGGVRCTIQSQIEEGAWVATSYTLSEEREDHMGVMVSRVAEGRIGESHVVARTVSDSPESSPMRASASASASSARKVFN